MLLALMLVYRSIQLGHGLGDRTLHDSLTRDDAHFIGWASTDSTWLRS